MGCVVGGAAGVAGRGVVSFQEGREGIEERAGAGAGLLHGFAPDALGLRDDGGVLGEVTGEFAEKGAEIAGGAGGFVVAALEFVEEDAEGGLGRAGIEMVKAAGVVFAFAQELGAEGEAVEVLFVGEVAGIEGVEFGERFLAALFLPRDKRGGGAAEVALGVANAGVGGGHGMIGEVGFEVAVEDRFELGGGGVHVGV